MGNSSVSFKIKTPTRTLNVPRGDTVTLNEKFLKEIEKNVALVTLNKISDFQETAIEQTLSIVATFFQRVVARTPLDEDYTYTIDGESYFHKADTIQVRYDWTIKLGKKTITAKEIKDALGEEVFFQVNNADSISKIKEFIRSGFTTRKGTFSDIRKCSIYNDNPHFTVIEYGGGYHWGSDSPVKENLKSRLGLDHRVKNEHSVQAPAGMLRITQAELMRSADNTKAKTDLSARYKGQKKGRAITPSDYMLKQFVNKLKSGNFKIDDIERFIGQR